MTGSHRQITGTMDQASAFDPFCMCSGGQKFKKFKTLCTNGDDISYQLSTTALPLLELRPKLPLSIVFAPNAPSWTQFHLFFFKILDPPLLVDAYIQPKLSLRYLHPSDQSWLCGTVVERWSLAGKLSLSCALPVADR